MEHIMIELFLSLQQILNDIPNKPINTEPTMSIVKVINTPLVGLWRLDLPEAKGDCQEVYHFKPNNQFSVVSAAEWTYGTYKVKQLSGQKLPLIAWKTIYDDNNTDCSGVKKDQSGEVFLGFYKHEEPNTFQLCVDPDGKQCELTLHRVLP